MSLLEKVLPSIGQMSSPRAWGFALHGIYEYQKKFNDDRLAKTIQRQLLDKLMFRYSETATDEWPWFESKLTYDNAILAHALIRSSDERMQAVGLKSLRWLVAMQTAERGHFQPIGSNGFYERGKTRAYFDQQPLEAQSTVSACLTAFQVTGDEEWNRTAIRVFKWFTGLNDLGLPLYDQQTGGCRDGLHIDRVNKNQGAESTLSYLLALAELFMAQKRRQETKPVSLDMPSLINA